ncbi:hypothetical protein D9M71_780150 [compost metagenome]
MVVNRRHTGGDVLQHTVQVLALGDLDALAVQNANRFFQCLAYGLGAQRQHPMQARLLGQFQHRRRADDTTASQLRHLVHRCPCLLQGGVGRLVELHGEQPGHGLQFGIDVAVAEDCHL